MMSFVDGTDCEPPEPNASSSSSGEVPVDDELTQEERPEPDTFWEEVPLEEELTQEEQTDLCRAFALLDSDGDGVIDFPELNRLLASWGRLPEDEGQEQEEISGVCSSLLPSLYTLSRTFSEGVLGMDFESFRRCVVDQLAGTGDEEELRRAFQVFDSDPPTGRVNLVELRHHLKETGLELTDDEIDSLFREQDYWMLEEKYFFEYEELVNKIMGKQVKSPFLNF